MKLYKLVEIRSVEQAEAIPEGTVILTHPDHQELADVGFKLDGDWVTLGSHGSARPSGDMVGSYALTAIEAEVEDGVDPHAVEAWQYRTNPAPPPARRRYITEWESA